MKGWLNVAHAHHCPITFAFFEAVQSSITAFLCLPIKSESRKNFHKLKTKMWFIHRKSHSQFIDTRFANTIGIKVMRIMLGLTQELYLTNKVSQFKIK